MRTRPRFLIIGGDGVVGGALRRRFDAQRVSYVATSRRDKVARNNIYFDISDPPEDWPHLPEVETVFFCAAITKLDVCEDASSATYQINVVHMKALAERVQFHGGRVVFPSSNQVFDGSKPMRRAEEPTCPVNAYGRQKAEFEEWLLARDDPGAVLRLTKVVAERLPVTIGWEEKLNAGQEVEAFSDLAFSPLPIQSVLDGMLDIATGKKNGLFQLSGCNQLSYYDIACKLAARLGRDASLVKPASALDAGIRPQFLPRYGTLDTSTMPCIVIPDIDCL